MALAFLRRHRSWFNWFLVAIIVSFVVLYIPTDFDANGQSAGAAVAEVAGERITLGEYQKAYQRRRQELQDSYKGQVDDEMLKRMGLPEQTLDGLIDQRVLVLEARRVGLDLDDQTVAHHLATSPEFFVNGRYMGGAELRRRLDRIGITEGEFTASLRNQMLQQRLASLVTAGVSVTPAEAEREFRRRYEQVKLEYVRMHADVAQASVTDDEVKARFEARKDEYRFPERRVVAYLLLDPAALQSRVTVTDREVETYFTSRPDEFKQAEEVCASHVLVKVRVGAEGEGHPDEEARKIAQGALEQARAAGDFAALAKKLSEDQGSASTGGELGCFGRGRMVPEFENAAFALKPGEISDVVKSDFGYHVIRVASRKEEMTLPLAQVRDRIRQSQQAKKLSELLEEKAQAVAGSLRKGRSLKDAASDHGLTPQKSAPLLRGEPRPPLSSAPLLSRVFELKQGEIEKEPFSVGGGYAFVSLEEIQAPRLPELKEVQDKVKADALLDKALEKARAVALDLEGRAEKDGLEKAALALGLLRKETPALVSRGQAFGDLGTSAAVEEVAFTLPEKTLSGPVRLPRGYALLRVVEKKAFDPAAFEQQKSSITATLAEERRDQLFRAYLREARKRFTVEKRPEVLRRATS